MGLFITGMTDYIGHVPLLHSWWAEQSVCLSCTVHVQPLSPHGGCPWGGRSWPMQEYTVAPYSLALLAVYSALLFNVDTSGQCVHMYVHTWHTVPIDLSVNVPSHLVSLPVDELHNPSFTEYCVTRNVVGTCEVRLLMHLDYRITHRGSSAGGVVANEVQYDSAVHNKEDTHRNGVCCGLAQVFCNEIAIM